MKKEIFKYLTHKISSDPDQVNRIVVTSFLLINQLEVFNNSLLKSLIIQRDDEDWVSCQQFTYALLSQQDHFSFENLIELFEFVVSPSDKKVNGAVYTPEYIKTFIIEQVAISYKGDLTSALACDVACGCGGFLYSYARYLHEQIGLPYKHIYEQLIHGVDITKYSIDRSAIILSLAALLDREDSDFAFNLSVGNALGFDWQKEFELVGQRGGFDVIIGNPPYVCAKNIANESRQLLNKWSVSQSGNPDLYIPFFQLALEALNSSGILGYITVNTFTKSLNGRKLREYFFNRSFGLRIVDFGGEQVFKGRTTYTCVCIVSKKSTPHVEYLLTSTSNLSTISDQSFSKILYKTLTNHNRWVLSEGETRLALDKIRSAGTSLESYVDIRGGFATLKNHIFVFKPVEATKTHYLLRAKTGKDYWIEKNICRDAVKANSLKKESDLNTFLEKIIFPYQSGAPNELFKQELPDPQAKLVLLNEQSLATDFPSTYQYLLDSKEELAERDKGNGNYEAWYAFGRSQGLNLQGYKLLFPHISDKPYFVYTEHQNLMFYNGFAVVSWNQRKLRFLQKILNSDLFWFFVRYTSKPYSGNYFGLGKNFIRDFGIPTFSEEEKTALISYSSRQKINAFLADKYNIPLNIFSSVSKTLVEA